MSNKYKQITPEDVYVTVFDREATEVELWNGMPRHFNGNRPSGNDFIDLFARLIRKYRSRQISFYAEEIGCDPVMFSKTITVLTGMTATQWRDRYLMLTACELLESTDREIRDVSDFLGFARPTIFTQFFLHHKGTTPRKWRKGRSKGTNKQ